MYIGEVFMSMVRLSVQHPFVVVAWLLEQITKIGTNKKKKMVFWVGSYVASSTQNDIDPSKLNINVVLKT